MLSTYIQPAPHLLPSDVVAVGGEAIQVHTKNRMENMAKIIIMAMVLVVLSGCAGNPEFDLMSMDKQITEELKNMATVKLELWPFWSGMITEILRERADEVPQNVWTAIAMLDMLSNAPVNDYGLGTSFALNIKISYYIISEALEEFAPELLEILVKALL